MTNHLYIHIPFCKNICSYCDFSRKHYKQEEADKYIKNIESKIKNKYSKNKFKTIYIGGGTPNCLSLQQIDKLLSLFDKNKDNLCEFTIECNPEFISKDQITIFKKYNINRVSLGFQTTNNNLLIALNRKHSSKQAIEAISLLQKNGITNISCDFIYGFNELSKKDIKKSIKLMVKNKVKHLSFYALEKKENSQITKENYQLSEELSEEHLKFIINKLDKKYIRYEISNWCLSNEYKSQHNLAYWKTDDWAAIGWKSYGLENGQYYVYNGSINQWKIESKLLSNEEYYFQIMMMGLRLIDGIDLSHKNSNDAYLFFKNKLDKLEALEISNNRLKCKNINLLNNLLIELI